ncbi:peptide deformylase [Bartonella sp. F02]|uniref:peptide deformylase n=1 Tax=Bartonella sp. F02 TaxID=2967262 RepID=UPI0022A9804A|nr:peptide deformylase [Bartonella sp. F02]MCZ2327994.1 peptide deformylase [Bartonella sp. F02]
MSIQPLVTLPDPILREISKPIEDVNTSIQKLADDMIETMRSSFGVGLAAIQIGVPLRMLVIDIRMLVADLSDKETLQDSLVVINPEVLWISDERSVCQEGCLSIPGYFAEVERPKSLRIRYRDICGQQVEIDADQFFATCLQHEIDHLDGRLFIDHISKTKRDMVIRKFKKRNKISKDATL